MRVRHPVLTVLGAVALVVGALSAAPALAATTQGATSSTLMQHTCATPTNPHTFACFSIRRSHSGSAPQALAPNATPSGYGPSDLLSAYALSASGGAGKTVAIVDAFDDPSAEADLATYRTQFGLPACTTANGCFKKVGQTGTATLPTSDAGWAAEISLDVDMVSAICPNCHILLVEANSATDRDLYTAEDYAATHAGYVSNSWGGAEYTAQTTDDAHFNHPGVAITASSGDNGNGASFPASSRFVTAVGGTTLRKATNTRGWTETAWSGAGSGCSAFDAKPTFQTVTTGCARRAEADVSAVADPNTGVAVFDSFGGGGGWSVFGGTSASSPIIASVYALAGTPGATDAPASYPYAHAANLFDVTSGSNGTCGAPQCTAGTGWDGPTGLGSPNGTAAFTTGTGGGGGTGGVTVTNPGNQTGVVGTAANLTVSASGGTGTFTWAATGLPAGLALNASTGAVTGTPTTAGTSNVTVSASSGGQTGSAAFTWTVTAASGGGGGTGTCAAGNMFGNGGFETGSAAPWQSTNGVVSNTTAGETAHAGSWYAWLDGYGSRHTDTLRQTVTIAADCSTANLTFWLKIDTQDRSTTRANDKLTVKVGSSTLATYSNLNHGGYVQKSLSLARFVGQTVTITFTGTENSGLATSFVIDDAAVQVG